MEILFENVFLMTINSCRVDKRKNPLHREDWPAIKFEFPLIFHGNVMKRELFPNNPLKMMMMIIIRSFFGEQKANRENGQTDIKTVEGERVYI